MRGLIALVAAMLLAAPALASTVTYTDPVTGEVSSTAQLPADGRFQFRIQVADLSVGSLPTDSVLVTDDTGQMQTGCYPIQDGQTILVTSELVVAAQPVVTITGKSYRKGWLSASVLPLTASTRNWYVR